MNAPNDVLERVLHQYPVTCCWLLLALLILAVM